MPPVSDGSGQDRALLRKASQMLQDAGFPIKNGKRVDAKGQPITIEFVEDDPQLQAHHAPLIKNLAILGIDATLRIVDPAQYMGRRNDFDFDITMDRMSFSTTPGDALRTYFSSAAADAKGSQNLAGIADPAVDALIDRIIGAETRNELVVAARALDRILRAGQYWIAQWHRAAHPIAYWDVFAHPESPPFYARGVPETWWYDRDKAAKLDKSG